MSRIKMDYDFLSAIYIGGELHVNKYRLVLNMFSFGELPTNQATALSRVEFFIQEIVQRSVIISETDLGSIAKFELLNIPTLTLPDPGPFDQLVQAALVTKINNIMEGSLVVVDAELSSIAGGLITYVYDALDEEDEDEDENELTSLINSDDDDNWWASAEPRFFTLNDQNRDKYDVQDWGSLELDYVVDVVFEPDFETDEPDEPENPDSDSTVIKISDFNKK
jgi:hypothetical protein